MTSSNDLLPTVAQRLYRLRENEIDLQTELNDLVEEIATREARIVEVLRLLSETRRERRALETLA